MYDQDDSFGGYSYETQEFLSREYKAFYNALNSVWCAFMTTKQIPDNKARVYWKHLKHIFPVDKSEQFEYYFSKGVRFPIIADIHEWCGKIAKEEHPVTEYGEPRCKICKDQGHAAFYRINAEDDQERISMTCFCSSGRERQEAIKLRIHTRDPRLGKKLPQVYNPKDRAILTHKQFMQYEQMMRPELFNPDNLSPGLKKIHDQIKLRVENKRKALISPSE